MKTTIPKRILKLELAAGLIETAADRRDRELGQIVLQRILAERAREGLPPLKISQEALSRLTLKDIVYGLDAQERAKALAERERIQQASSTGELPDRRSD